MQSGIRNNQHLQHQEVKGELLVKECRVGCLASAYFQVVRFSGLSVQQFL